MGFEENKEKKGKTFIIIGVILVVIVIAVVFFLGVRGILKIFGTILVIAMFLGLLFLLGYLFWHIFLKKHRYDVTYVNKQRLIMAGKLMGKDGVMGDLYVSGDMGHNRYKIGKILGYCRIQVLTRENKYDKNKNIIMKEEKVGQFGETVKVPDYTIGKEEQDVFILKKGLFQEPLVVRVSPEDHDELVGDVTLKGFSLIPHSEYMFLNSDYLDVRKIDFAILKEAERGIMFESLRDMKSIVDKAVGLDSSHKKDIEKKNLVDIPDQSQQR